MITEASGSSISANSGAITEASRDFPDLGGVDRT